jgi:hypothetical protein
MSVSRLFRAVVNKNYLQYMYCSTQPLLFAVYETAMKEFIKLWLKAVGMRLHLKFFCPLIMFVINRKRIYQDVFEYDYPLMNPESRVFQFIQPDENEYENQWKESFKQLVRTQTQRTVNTHFEPWQSFPFFKIDKIK